MNKIRKNQVHENKNCMENNHSEELSKRYYYLRNILICFLCAAFVLLSLYVSNAYAQSTCIPYAHGVPALWGPPNWWNESLSPPYYYNQTDDPRWRGAVSHTYGGGAGEEISFRALYDSQNSLYLSWHIDADPSMDAGHDLLVVGFSPGGGADDIVIKIIPFGDLIPKEGELYSGTTTYIRNQTTGDWDGLVSEPQWIQEFTRVWLTNTTPYSWAIQMKVPNSSNLDSGVNIYNNFDMWFEVQVVVTNSTTGDNVKIPYKWPRNVPYIIGPIGFPAISTWGNFSLGVSGQECEKGVSISRNNIGTLNTDSDGNPRPHQILINGTNTFYAKPLNEIGETIFPNMLLARFRIANWGSQPNWNEVDDPSQLWSSIGEGNEVPNWNSISNGTLGNIQFDWILNDSEKDPFLSGEKRMHQCMLVELSGSNLTFVTDSVYRNMDFVHASTFDRDAEISVVGLAPIGEPERDVYLYVETKNMPDVIEPAPLPPDETIWDESRSVLPFSWDSVNFDGFDVNGIGTEKLSIVQEDLGAAEGKTRTIRSGELTYETTSHLVKYQVSKNKNLSIPYALDSGGNIAESGQYYSRLNWFGEPYVNFWGDISIIFKLVLEQNESQVKVLRSGDIWELENGFTLSAESDEYGLILVLRIDGEEMDRYRVFEEGEVYTYIEDMPVFITYIDNIKDEPPYEVQLKYTWAVSPNNYLIPPEISEIGVFDIHVYQVPMSAKSADSEEIRPDLYAENNKEIVLSPNKIIPLSNTLNFKVMNDAKSLKFYPAVIKPLALEDMPSYRVFAYHDTGNWTVVDGLNYSILRPQGSFGYYIETDEDIARWNSTLQGAQEIAPNFYKLAVPNNGTATVKTIIEAVEPGPDVTPEPTPEPWWPLPWWVWLLVVIIIVILFVIIRRSP
jgi:hypothetical protein